MCQLFPVTRLSSMSQLVQGEIPKRCHSLPWHVGLESERSSQEEKRLSSSVGLFSSSQVLSNRTHTLKINVHSLTHAGIQLRLHFFFSSKEEENVNSKLQNPVFSPKTPSGIQLVLFCEFTDDKKHNKNFLLTKCTWPLSLSIPLFAS